MCKCEQPPHIRRALDTLSDIHATYWDSPANLPEGVPIERIDLARYQASETLLNELTAFNAMRYPDLITAEMKVSLKHVLSDLPTFVNQMLQQPMTLTHNDFNPRNLCFRSGNNTSQMVVYDWELSMYQNPQHDLVEFLIFILDGDSPISVFENYADQYYRMLADKVTDLPTKEDFDHGLFLNAVDLALIRFNLYLMGHNILHFNFIDRVYRNLCRYLLHARHNYS